MRANSHALHSRRVISHGLGERWTHILREQQANEETSASTGGLMPPKRFPLVLYSDARGNRRLHIEAPLCIYNEALDEEYGPSRSQLSDIH